MSKNKRKSKLIDTKNFLIIGIAGVVVVLIAVVMNLILPGTTRNNSFDDAAWQSATDDVINADEPTVDEAEETGLIPVYEESAVATASDAVVEPDPVSSDNPIMPIAGAITKDYSGEELVYSQTMDDWRTHNGIDIAAEEGTDVFAILDGTVEAVTHNGMLGATVIILHKDGMRSIYSNLADDQLVAPGDSVKQGSTIGRCGDTAAEEVSEPPHLHFEISINEEPANPHDYLPTGNNAE